MHKTKHLRQLLLSAVAVLLGSFMIMQAKQDETEITLRNLLEQVDNEGAPRSSGIPIEAFYDSDLSSVCATLTDAGTSVYVDFVNHTTNETAEYIIPGSGSYMMPISGTSGYWTITFTLSGGEIIVGDFIL